MTRALPFIVCWFCTLAPSLEAVSVPGLRYLGEVGHLWPPFSASNSVKFGQIQVTGATDGTLQLAGRDDDPETLDGNGTGWQRRRLHGRLASRL